MLFPGQNNVDRTTLEKLRRTAQRLREEGLGPLSIKQQLTAIASGLGFTGYVVGRSIEAIVKSTTKRPSDQESGFTTPEQPAKKPKLTMSPALRGKDDNTDGDGDTQMAVAKAGPAPKASSLGKLTEETPILPHAPEYGLPETYTALLPLTTWFSVCNVDKASAVLMEVNMNTPVNPIISSIGNTPSGGSAYQKGLFNGVTEATSTWPTNITPYPNSAGGTNPTGAEVCAWRTYFEKLYDVYTVLGCQWKLTIQTSTATMGNCAAIGVGYNSYGSSGGTSGVFPTGQTYADVSRWKDVKWTIVEDNREATKTTVLTGTYRPGQNKRNVTNDQDVNTWTLCESTPSFKEELQLMFFKAPLAPSNTLNMNCQLELKYIVQYKDLKTQIRYPYNGGTAITQSLPAHALQSW